MTKAELLATVSALAIADDCQILLNSNGDIAAIERIATIASDGPSDPAFGLIYAAPVEARAPMPDASRFWAWFDAENIAAKASPIGQVFAAANPAWNVHHTGGGCMAWALETDDGQADILICDDDSSLGDERTESWLIGLHPRDDWRENFQTDCATLDDALAIVPAILAARAFALGFRA